MLALAGMVANTPTYEGRNRVYGQIVKQLGYTAEMDLFWSQNKTQISA